MGHKKIKEFGTHMNRQISRACHASMAVLFCNGLLYATWGVSVPAIKDKFGLSEGVLAAAMAAVALGGIVTMARAGRWIAAVGSGRASVQSGLLMAAAAAPVLLMSNYPALLLLLCVYGIATAANDVAANSQGAHLEHLSRQSVIGQLHASFSVGGLAGSLIASAWSGAALPASANFWVLAGAVALAMVWASRHLLNEADAHTAASPPAPAETDSAQDPRVMRRLRVFGALAFSALVVEGAFYDWAAVYMREVIKAPASWVGLGYAAFAIGMAVGRLCGDKIRDRYAHQAVMTLSGAICVTGLAIVLGTSSPSVVVAGFGITGIGLSNFIPMLFSSAGRLSQHAGLPASQGLAVTTRMAYVGLLVGPLLIGPFAQWVGLRLSLVTLALAVGLTCVGWLVLSHKSGGKPWALQAPTGRRA